LDAYTVEKRFIHRQGHPVWARLTLSLVRDAHGRPYYEVAIVENITDRKRAEEALTSANARLAEADRRKDEFIAILSHELRNPLAPIRYALPLLQRERLGQPAARAVAVVDRQLLHLTRLVDDLLDVSRITRGKLELQKDYVTLGSIVNAATEAASPIVTAARHTLKINVANDPIWMHADAARLAQVVTNLLNNSAKYTPRGGEIALEAGTEGGEAVIRVRDNGIGIPAEALPTIFEMFRQVSGPDRGRGADSAGPDKTQGGLGIGLALVKRLVEMHGGSIDARSDGPGRGAEFVVRLPIAREASARQAAAAPAAWRAPDRRLKVLVVDDNADLVEMLATLVSTLGHDVRKALDGRSAVSAATAYRPDVVFLDLGLPVMSGVEVARELKRLPETAGAILIALTGWGQAEDLRQTTEGGFDHHMTKPTDPKKLERLLAQLASEMRP
jgi:signal transduction histidine kinase/ActR/RegA family two-component response regulator